MSEEKRCIIDLREMGDRYGLELVDVVKDGKVIMRDHAWNQPALQKAVAECRQRAKGADIPWSCGAMCPTGLCPPWPMRCSPPSAILRSAPGACII